jgi:hypothetical protein
MVTRLSLRLDETTWRASPTRWDLVLIVFKVLGRCSVLRALGRARVDPQALC